MAYDFKFPDVGEGIHEGELVKWKVKEGETVKADQPLCDIETDKALVEIPSPKAGKILKLHFKEGDTVPVGRVLVTIDDGSGASMPRPAAPAPAPAPAKKGSTSIVGEVVEGEGEGFLKPQHVVQKDTSAAVRAQPAARKLAKDLNVDIARVRGTGPEGVITAADVAMAAKGGSPAPAPVAAPTSKAPRVTFEGGGRVLRIPMRGLRKKTAEVMAMAWAKVPHVTHADDADVTALWALRAKEKDHAESKGIKLTFLPFIMKAAIRALQSFPYFNSTLDEATGEIVVKQFFNIGFAVQTPDGLMVANVKDADKKSIMELAKEIGSLADKARDRTIDIENVRGSTFTITNIGSVGGKYATPIVNYPEVAILGVGKITDAVVAVDGKAVIRKIMPVFLSFDHRVQDGVAAAQFVNAVIEGLQDPEGLLIGE